MSYSEQDGQVVLTMSREDYESLVMKIFPIAAAAVCTGEGALNWQEVFALLDRLNFGNPHYTPYQVEKEKP